MFLKSVCVMLMGKLGNKYICIWVKSLPQIDAKFGTGLKK